MPASHICVLLCCCHWPALRYGLTDGLALSYRAGAKGRSSKQPMLANAIAQDRADYVKELRLFRHLIIALCCSDFHYI